jgi:hypothetical protein
MAELIRVIHSLSLEEAQQLLDSISTRQIPYVWSVMGRLRILEPDLDYPSQTLLLGFSSSESAIPVEDIFDWVEHPRLANYRSDVLNRLHESRLIEYDKENQMVVISPSGIARVEEQILPSLERNSV